jgi:AcrR family transcriptional regulator
MKKESARERILAAAFELISSKGYLGTSTREIAQQADVAEVTIFRHFASKEKLFDEIAPRFFMLSELEELLPQFLDLPIDEGVATLAATYIEKLSGIQNWIRIYHSEIQRKSEKFPMMCQLYMDCLFEICNGYFRQVAGRGNLRCSDPETTARLFIMLCYGYHQIGEMHLEKEAGDGERQQIVDTMVRLFVCGKGMNARQGDGVSACDARTTGPDLQTAT